MGRTLIVLIAGVLIASESSAQGLSCDDDPLSDGCVQCRIDLPLLEQQGICFERRPPSTAGKQNFECPKRVRELRPSLALVTAKLHEALEKNAELTGKLKPFRDTGNSDCALLTEDIFGLTNDSARSNDFSEIDPAVELFEKVEDCMTSAMERVKGATLKHSTAPILKEYLLEISDLQIKIDKATEFLADAHDRRSQLQEWVGTYEEICSY